MSVPESDSASGLPTGARWDRNYADPDYIFGEAPNEFLRSKASLLTPGMTALVPGDGEGRNGVWLAERGLLATTVEASLNGVEKAKSLARKRRVDINAIHADLERWDWPENRFDLIASIFLHLHPSVREGLHRKMLRALQPGGLLLLEAYTPRQLEHRKAGAKGGPPPEMLFTAAVLAGDFSAMAIDELAEVETTLAEGKRHNGPASVVRLLARRRI
ncbi:MAG: class I SAM-dependent methyltransferase [Hyphomicrobiaceae bacterium]|nr:MAG: class I SAM-dependent methyltransferase [Hyphomicrobiaceae bacterium]